MTATQGDGSSRRAALLGWPLIAVIGGGAVLASLAILAFLIVMVDMFMLAKGPITTEYSTIVETKHQYADSTGVTGYVYVVRGASGALTDVMLPLQAKPGDRVRIRLQRSRLLKLASAAEAPVLCPSAGPCE